MADFDITGHALLSETAAALTAPVLLEHTRVAEKLLGVTSDTAAYSAADQLWVKRALALQVTMQVAMPETIFSISSESLGALSTSFWQDPKMKDPRALEIISAIVGGAYPGAGWNTLRSARSNFPTLGRGEFTDADV